MQVERTGRHFPRHRGRLTVAMVALLMVTQRRDTSGFSSLKTIKKTRGSVKPVGYCNELPTAN